MNVYYYKELHGNRLIRNNDVNGLTERFDFNEKKWVVDYEMAQIYFGGIEVQLITEIEANKLIEARLKS